MVSAIITTYKREPSMVLRALDSVLAQTYNDLEVIIVDDSPNDYSQRENVRLAVKRKQEDNTAVYRAVNGADVLIEPEIIATSRRKRVAIGVRVIEKRESQLLEVVGALHASRRFARRLNRRQEKTD